MLCLELGSFSPPATFPSSVSQLISRADVNVCFVGMQFLFLDPVNSDLILDRAMLVFVFFWFGAVFSVGHLMFCSFSFLRLLLNEIVFFILVMIDVGCLFLSLFVFAAVAMITDVAILPGASRMSLARAALLGISGFGSKFFILSHQ